MIIRKIGCHLPSKAKINNWIPIKSLNPSFHDENISLIKDMVSRMDNKDREATICFDEMAVSKNLVYDQKQDLIIGVRDYGNND